MVIAGCSQFGKSKDDVVLNHTVERGETLESIAEDYYGDPSRARRIRKFNDVDPNDIDAGDVVRIPMSNDDMVALRQRERARARFNEALALVERGSYIDATRLLREAVALDPGFADAHYNLGVTYQRMKGYESALRSYEQAVALQPDNADYRQALGGIHYHMNHLDAAIASFKQALTINGFHLKSQYSLAVAYEKNGDTQLAIAAWRRYLTLDNTSEWGEQAREHLEKLAQP